MLKIISCALTLSLISGFVALGCNGGGSADGGQPSNGGSGGDGHTSGGSGAGGGASDAGSTGDGDGDGGETAAAAGRGTGGSPSSGGVPPLGLAPDGYDTAGLSEEETLVFLAGEHEVVIFFTPEGEEAKLGRGTIEVILEQNNDVVRLALKDADGNVLVTAENSRSDPQDYGRVSLYANNKIIVHQRNVDEQKQFIDVNFYPDGFINGYVGNLAQYYRFRNNLVHYGLTVPPHLVTQAGTWSAPQLANTCDKPDVTVEITAQGSVTMSGQGNLDCTDIEVENAWDGQDDYIEPGFESGTVDVVLDSYKGGGSQEPGGIWITVNEDPGVEGVYLVETTLSGFSGALAVANPEKK